MQIFTHPLAVAYSRADVAHLGFPKVSDSSVITDSFSKFKFSQSSSTESAFADAPLKRCALQRYVGSAFLTGAVANECTVMVADKRADKCVCQICVVS